MSSRQVGSLDTSESEGGGGNIKRTDGTGNTIGLKLDPCETTLTSKDLEQRKSSVVESSSPGGSSAANTESIEQLGAVHVAGALQNDDVVEVVVSSESTGIENKKSSASLPGSPDKSSAANTESIKQPVVGHAAEEPKKVDSVVVIDSPENTDLEKEKSSVVTAQKSYVEFTQAPLQLSKYGRKNGGNHVSHVKNEQLPSVIESSSPGGSSAANTESIEKPEAKHAAEEPEKEDPVVVTVSNSETQPKSVNKAAASDSHKTSELSKQDREMAQLGCGLIKGLAFRGLTEVKAYRKSIVDFFSADIMLNGSEFIALIERDCALRGQQGKSIGQSDFSTRMMQHYHKIMQLDQKLDPDVLINNLGLLEDRALRETAYNNTITDEMRTDIRKAVMVRTVDRMTKTIWQAMQEKRDEMLGRPRSHNVAESSVPSFDLRGVGECDETGVKALDKEMITQASFKVMQRFVREDQMNSDDRDHNQTDTANCGRNQMRVDKHESPSGKVMWTQSSFRQLSDDLLMIGDIHLKQPRYNAKNDSFTPADSGTQGSQRIRQALVLFLKEGSGKLQIKHLVELLSCYTEQSKEEGVDKDAITINNRYNRAGIKAGVEEWKLLPVDRQAELRDKVVESAVNAFIEARVAFRVAMLQKARESVQRASGKDDHTVDEKDSSTIILGQSDAQPHELSEMADKKDNVGEQSQALMAHKANKFIQGMGVIKTVAQKKAATLVSKMSKEVVVGIKQLDDKNLTLPFMASVRLFANCFDSFQESPSKRKTGMFSSARHSVGDKFKSLKAAVLPSRKGSESEAAVLTCKKGSESEVIAPNNGSEEA